METILDPGSTFKTSIDVNIDYVSDSKYHGGHRSSNNKDVTSLVIPTISNEHDELKLPSTISIITLTETILAHAPFITRSNRMFWRRWLLRKQFQQVLISGFYGIAECLSKDGGLDVARLYDISSSMFLKAMSNNFCQLFYVETPGGVADRDLLLAKLPEILVFGVINALSNSSPKHSKVFNSIKFRELILDWASELIGGIRPSFCKAKCEWLFQNAQEGVLVITKNRPTTYVKGSEIPVYMQAACRGPYVLEHSPLLFIRLQKEPNAQPLSSSPLTTSLPAIGGGGGVVNKDRSKPESVPTNSNFSPFEASSSADYHDTDNYDGQNEDNHDRYNNTMESTAIGGVTINGNGNSNSNRLHLAESPQIRKSASYSQFNPLALKCSLTHPPNRPLVNITHADITHSIGKIRCKKADFPLISRTLKESKIARKNILSIRDIAEKKMRDEIKDFSENTHLQLKAITTNYIKNNRRSRARNLNFDQSESEL